MTEKKTALYDEHVELGGRMVPYAGWLLPVQYPSGTTKEHMAVRESCGLFDVSHMGEIFVKGPGAEAFLDYVLTNPMSTLKEGRVRYAILCQEDGGSLDDLVVYRLGKDDFMLVVNAANTDKDYAWLQDQHKKWTGDEVSLENKSDLFGLLALQGLKAKEVLEPLVEEGCLPTKFFSFSPEIKIKDKVALISQTGYTGEFGYEIYLHWNDVPTVWAALLQEKEKHGLLPCGLGARDTLRMEAGLPLYGHELSEEINPLEAGLGFAVKLDRPAFVGQDALSQELSRTRIGLEITDRGIAREDSDVYLDGEKIGHVSSGTKSPYTKRAIAQALVNTEANLKLDDEVEVDVRGKRLKAKVVDMPFYERKK